MVVEDKEERMERIYPKKKRLKQVDIYEAAELHEIHKEEIVVLVQTDHGMYESHMLEEFIEDCLFFKTE